MLPQTFLGRLDPAGLFAHPEESHIVRPVLRFSRLYVFRERKTLTIVVKQVLMSFDLNCDHLCCLSFSNECYSTVRIFFVTMYLPCFE